ncbi:MAG: branched-chain amino acid ABC transporter permease [Bradyrhizobiaceae bacterium]|nr:MAG: branched-chain amino acid ABC transporter permease [Bradyrhizobiaceae bacterium]
MAYRRILTGLLIVGLLVAPFMASWAKPFLILAFSKGLAVLGIIILLQAGQVSFGHALFFAVGAYATAFIGRYYAGGELLTLLLLSVVISGLFGLVLGLFVVRYRYIFFGMLNLAFSMVLYSILEKFFHVTGGSDGIRVARPSVVGIVLERSQFELVLYFVTVVLAGLIALLVTRYLRSPLGESLRAIKSNETRLEYVGISARRVLLYGYVSSAVLCGIGGCITAIEQGLATPEYAFWIRSGEFVFIAILGGAAHVMGAFAGAVVYEGIRIFASVLFADGWQLVLGLMLLAVVFFAPEGIVGSLSRLTVRRRKPKAPVATTATPEAAK